MILSKLLQIVNKEDKSLIISENNYQSQKVLEKIEKKESSYLQKMKINYEKYNDLVTELKEKRNNFEKENIKNLENDDNNIYDDLLCIICYKQFANTKIKPCLHKGCKECIMTYMIDNEKCFMCRQPIESIQPISKNGHFKLSDFGLSKTINEKKIKVTDEGHSAGKSSENSSISSLMDSEHNDNKVEGTLFYMSPELFTGDYPVGKPIDYWAIGIIIFELFTFKVPFEADSQEETKENIINYNINWDPIYSDDVVKHYKDYIDPAVDLIKKFIFFNPSQRWGDNDFEKIKNHEFFKGFDWTNIKSIKSTAVMSHLKKVVEENNKKIKEFNKGNAGEGMEIKCEENLTYDEDNTNNNRFSQRIDNLLKRNNELIRMKFKKKGNKI